MSIYGFVVVALPPLVVHVPVELAPGPVEDWLAVSKAMKSVVPTPEVLSMVRDEDALVPPIRSGLVRDVPKVSAPLLKVALDVPVMDVEPENAVKYPLAGVPVVVTVPDPPPAPSVFHALL
jgi:hypothetical protein